MFSSDSFPFRQQQRTNVQNPAAALLNRVSQAAVSSWEFALSFHQPNEDQTTASSGWQRFSRVIAFLLAIAITVTVYLLRETITEWAGFGYAGVFTIMLVSNATVILPAPSWLFVLATSNALNPVLLGLVAAIGASIGELTGYLAGYAGRDTIENRFWYRRVVRLMARYGAWIIVILGAIPNPIFDVAGIAAGALRVPAWKFLAAAIVGKTIRFVLLALLGTWLL